MFDPLAQFCAIHTFDDAAALAFFLNDGLCPPAPACVVVLDAEGNATGSVLVVDCDDAVIPLLDLAASVGTPLTELRFLVVSMHDGGSTCDPDDVLEWEEAHGAVAAAGARLIDWIVVTDTLAVSKARFAPTPGLAGPP